MNGQPQNHIPTGHISGPKRTSSLFKGEAPGHTDWELLPTQCLGDHEMLKIKARSPTCKTGISTLWTISPTLGICWGTVDLARISSWEFLALVFCHWKTLWRVPFSFIKWNKANALHWVAKGQHKDQKCLWAERQYYKLSLLDSKGERGICFWERLLSSLLCSLFLPSGSTIFFAFSLLLIMNEQ